MQITCWTVCTCDSCWRVCILAGRALWTTDTSTVTAHNTDIIEDKFKQVFTHTYSTHFNMWNHCEKIIKYPRWSLKSWYSNSNRPSRFHLKVTLWFNKFWNLASLPSTSVPSLRGQLMSTSESWGVNRIHTMHWLRIHGLAASAGVRLRANDTEISAAPWTLRLWKRLYFFLWFNYSNGYSPRAPFDHIWAMVWSGARGSRGNITITAL